MYESVSLVGHPKTLSGSRNERQLSADPARLSRKHGIFYSLLPYSLPLPHLFSYVKIFSIVNYLLYLKIRDAMLFHLIRRIQSLTGVWSSFTYLNITQFLGAMNDNIYKLLIIYFFIQIEGIERSHVILATVGAIFVLPFLLFSSSAGILADRFSKRNIIIGTKSLELIIMTLGLVSFYYSSKLGSYFTLFLLGTHSALFSPSKYGILPELLPSEKISKANGMMTSFTYLAIILGTFLASFLIDITHRNFIIAASFCVTISTVGLLASCCIPYTDPSGSSKKLNVHFLNDIYKTLLMVKTHPSLLAAILGSAFFLFIAAYTQLNMIPFAVQSLHLTDVQGGYLFLLTAIGIGTGSLLAGKISGKAVELGIVPFAALGITTTFYLLDIFSSSLIATVPLVIICGIFGGLYLIPLDSYVQVSAPKQFIGQSVAATTFLSFIGVLCASILLYVVTEVFGLTADKGFALLSSMTLIATIVFGYQFFDYLTRLIGMILSRLHFKITFTGQEKIPDGPALYICRHTAWNDTLLLLGTQRRRMRFFIENEKEHTKVLRKMYGFLRVVLIPEIEPLENNVECLTAIKNALSRGISVCIFVDNENVEKEFEKLKNSQLVKEILDEKNYPMLSVHIEKGCKHKTSRCFTKLMNKFRVPAYLSIDTLPWDVQSTHSEPASFQLERESPHLKSCDFLRES
jgi:acyl-[acyl-carrier-protein]-phospholipid O-acyltransferase/long-chain-fatty-acid--[acyl-carrier-protein] ligase